MQTPNHNPLLKLIGAHDNAADDPAALGRGVLRLAHYAAAAQRLAEAEQNPQYEPMIDPEWRGLTLTDSAGHGRPATSPLARLGGSEATEGDR